jgi:hypothetical protein
MAMRLPWLSRMNSWLLPPDFWRVWPRMPLTMSVVAVPILVRSSLVTSL